MRITAMILCRPLAPVLLPGALLAAALALGGCAGLAPDDAAPPARTNAGVKPGPVVMAPPPARPAAKPVPELGALRPSARPAPEREAVAVAPSPAGPLRLVGLSEDETVGLLGRPAEETAQPPGKIWIYRAAGCQLSVHLFPDLEKGGYYALDYAAADGGRDLCLGKVAGEARKRGGAVAEANKAG